MRSTRRGAAVMLRSRKIVVLGMSLAFLTGGAIWWVAANHAEALPQDQRAKLMKAHQDGNFKDAYEGLRKLALDPADDPKLVGKDLTTALNCLEQLGRVSEMDAFREDVIRAH